MAIIAFDCNGVLANSVPKLAAAGIEWAARAFEIKVDKERAEEMVLYFSGKEFSQGLGMVFQSLFPEGYDQDVLKQKAGELPQIIEGAYKKIEPFPEVVEALRRLEKRFRLVVSSTLKRAYLEIWLSGAGIGALFEGIYGEEDGGKEQHIKDLRKKYPQEKVYFVGNSAYEMKLGDVSIGVARQSWQKQSLEEAGADVIISSLSQLPGLLTY